MVRDGDSRARLFGGGWECSASDGLGAHVVSKRPSRLPAGRSGCSVSEGSCSDVDGELDTDIDDVLDASDIDSSLILVLSGSKTWC